MNEKLRMAQILLAIMDTEFDLMDAEMWLVAERKLGSQLDGVSEYRYIDSKIKDFGLTMQDLTPKVTEWMHSWYLYHKQSGNL